MRREEGRGRGIKVGGARPSHFLRLEITTSCSSCCCCSSPATAATRPLLYSLSRYKSESHALGPSAMIPPLPSAPPPPLPAHPRPLAFFNHLGPTRLQFFFQKGVVNRRERRCRGSEIGKRERIKTAATLRLFRGAESRESRSFVRFACVRSQLGARGPPHVRLHNYKELWGVGQEGLSH